MPGWLYSPVLGSSLPSEVAPPILLPQKSGVADLESRKKCKKAAHRGLLRILLNFLSQPYQQACSKLKPSASRPPLLDWLKGRVLVLLCCLRGVPRHVPVVLILPTC